MTIVDHLYQIISGQLSLDAKSGAGYIEVNLASVTCRIRGKDAVGHLVQEWLYSWCCENDFRVERNASTQSFPDYYVLNSEGQKDFLEIKNFNLDASPAFDVADFYAFIESLPNEIEKLYADYLVFGYRLSSEGTLSIPKVWKLKIWELVGRSSENFVTCQIRGKRMEKGIDVAGRTQKLRPRNIKVLGGSGAFVSASQFLIALQELLNTNRNTREADYGTWLMKVRDAHVQKYGRIMS
jgi:hypothetical protein